MSFEGTPSRQPGQRFRWSRLAADRNLTDASTALEPLFGSDNDSHVLAPGIWRWKCRVVVNTQSATSGNLTFSIIGAGTATITAPYMVANGIDATGVEAGTISSRAANMTGWAATTTGGNFTTAQTGTASLGEFHGEFDCTASGTVVPSVAQTTATAGTPPVAKAGCYVEFEWIGTSGTTTSGGT